VAASASFLGWRTFIESARRIFLGVGVPIYQGYGLTETSPIVSSNYPKNRVGSSGQPIPHSEVRIASDGEVQVRGPMIMQGYYKRPDATREVLDDEAGFQPATSLSRQRQLSLHH